MKKNELIRSSAAEYLTYTAAVGGGSDSMEMRYEDENIWLTQKMMAALYDVSIPAINQHLKTIFTDGELVENSVIKKYLTTAADGKSYNTKHYLYSMSWIDSKSGSIRVDPFCVMVEYKLLLSYYFTYWKIPHNAV